MKIHTLFLLLLITACSVKESEQQSIEMDEDIITVGNGSELPYLFKDNSGGIYISWVEETDEKVEFNYATFNEDGSWSEPILITKGNDWFINWADYPMIATLKGEQMIAHYLSKSSEDTYSYDVSILTSQNGGNDWSTPKVLHDDGKKAEHGFVSMLPYVDNFFIGWLDGRNTSMEEGHHGQMTLRGAIVTPKGEKLKEWELDDRVCDCCQTGAAITSNGPVIVYRNRSDEEIRDIYITRLVNDKWTEPQAVYDDGWEIMGCPVNGPRVTAKGLNVAVAWYTASPYARVNLAFSNDGGGTFSQPIQVDESEPLGRVDVALIDEKSAFVTWMEVAEIKGAIVTNNKIVKRFSIATSSSSRGSGFPQMEIIGNKVLVAWTDIEDNRIKTKLIEL